jgi:hypothetical protein
MQAAVAVGVRFNVVEFGVFGKKPVQVADGSANIAWHSNFQITGIVGKYNY